MKIDNSKQAGHVIIFFTLVIVLEFVALGVHYISFITLSEDTIIALWCLLLVTLLLYRFGGFEYVSFEFNDDEVDIKYYRLFPFGRKFNRIVILYDMLGEFKIQKGLGSLFTSLILFQNRGGVMAQYPPLGMAATTSHFREDIIKELNESKID